MTDETIVERLRSRKLCKDGVSRQPEKVKREAADAIEALRARVAELEQAAFSWIAYDQLLRSYAGPKDMLCEGDFALADKTYDECVKATVAALKGNQP